MGVSFVDAILFIELFHIEGVDADDGDVNRQRALRRHIKAQREAEEGDAVQLTRLPAFHEGDNKPNGKQYAGDKKIFLPVFLVFCTRLHSPSLVALVNNPVHNAA